MAALEEFELGIDHIRNAFKRADNGFTNAYKMLEAEQQKNHKLEAENAKLRELVRDLRFCARQSICLKCEHGRICDLRLDERCAELGIEVCE